MTTIASLVRALNDIDAYKGRTCMNCFYRSGRDCRLGHQAYTPDDGCGDFRARPVDAWKAWPVPRQPQPRQTHQRPANESGGAI